MQTIATSSVGLPVSPDHLASLDFASMSKTDRWQLIDRIEKRIDELQSWLLKARGQHQPEVTDTLVALRLKRFQIWNSFYPQFDRTIRVGVA